MSESSQNLIEVQANLQDPIQVSIKDLIKYANGSNPQVPSFLALMELNRRKQIEQTGTQFAQPSNTLKDQMIASITSAQPQVNPAAPAPAINPAAPPQFVNPAAQQRQVNPAAPPAPVQAARGGLMQLPVNNMFHAKNYASGGIVAFSEGGQSKYVEDSPGHYVLQSEEYPAPERKKYKIGNQEFLGPRSQEEILAGLPGITPLQAKRPEDMSIEQAAQRQKEIQKVAGVADDPYAEAKQFQKDLEARQAEERKSNALDRLLAQAEAFATADPARGFGAHAAASSKASRTLEAEQRAIREKQDAVSLDFRRNMAKEEDARRRGDATGIAAALERQKADQAAYDKLQLEWEKADQSRMDTAAKIRQAEATEAKLPIDIYQAETQRDLAEAQKKYYGSQAAHQKFLQDEAARTKPGADEVMYTRIMGKVNQDPTIKALATQLKDLDPDDPKALQIQTAMHNKMKTYFVNHPDLLPPPPEQVAPLPKKKEPSWWDRNVPDLPEFLGGPPSPKKPPSATIPQGWTVQQNP